MATGVAACTNELPQSDEDFTDLAKQDAKSDAFSAKLRLLGTIHPGETLSSLAYTPGDHTYTMTAQGAEGIAQCSTSFTITP